MPSRLTFILCLLIAIAGGFLGGRWSVVAGHEDTRESNPTPLAGPAILSEDNSGDLASPSPDLLGQIREALAKGAWHPTRQWEQLVKSLAPTEIEAGLAVLAEAPFSQVNQKLTQSLYSNWAILEPNAAVEHARFQTRGFRREPAVQGALEGWAFADPSGMSDWINTLKDDALEYHAINALAPYLAAIDPAKAFAFAIASPNDVMINRELLRESVSAWAQTEPLVAMAAVDRHLRLRMHDRNFARMAVYSSWAQSDPMAAADHARDLTSRTDRASAFSGVMRTWASVDPDAALAYAQSNDLGLEYSRTMSAITSEIAEMDPERAIAIAENMPAGTDRRDVLETVLRSIAETDPEMAATVYLAALETGDELLGNLTDLGRQFAQIDPTAAMQWALALPAGEGRHHALMSVSKFSGRGNPEAVVDLVLQLPAGTEQNMMLAEIFRESSKQNPAGAATLYAKFPVGTFPEGVQLNIINSAASVDPTIAVAMVESLSDPQLRMRAAQSLMPGWTSVDPRAAAAWLAQQNWMDDDTLHTTALSLISTWGLWEPTASADWIRSLPNPAVKQNLWAEYIDKVRYENPAHAAIFITEIADSKTRIDLTRGVALRWLIIDSAAAIPWVRQSELPEEEKEELITQIGGG